MHKAFATIVLLALATVALAAPSVQTGIAPQALTPPQGVENPLDGALFAVNQACLKECLQIYRSCSLNCSVNPDPPACDSACSASYNSCRSNC
jgi:hypothetical protein